MPYSNGKVWLVGAGPGDSGLLTVKGKQILEQAEVILYDSLVGEGILAWMPDAEKISVGKRAGRHHMPQEEINLLLLEKAKMENELSGSKAATLSYSDEAGRNWSF